LKYKILDKGLDISKYATQFANVTLADVAWPRRDILLRAYNLKRCIKDSLFDKWLFIGSSFLLQTFSFSVRERVAAVPDISGN